MKIPGLALSAGTDDVPWRSTESPGVRWLLLANEEHQGPEPPARGEGRGATVLIRMEPGHGYPPHRHLDVEEVLVLAGGYADELGEHRAGDYVRYPAGSIHTPVALGDPDLPAGRENPACVLFATARGGITRASAANSPALAGEPPHTDRTRDRDVPETEH